MFGGGERDQRVVDRASEHLTGSHRREEFLVAGLGQG